MVAYVWIVQSFFKLTAFCENAACDFVDKLLVNSLNYSSQFMMGLELPPGTELIKCAFIGLGDEFCV